MDCVANVYDTVSLVKRKFERSDSLCAFIHEAPNGRVLICFGEFHERLRTTEALRRAGEQLP